MEKFTSGIWGCHLDNTIRNDDCTRVICKVTPVRIIETDEDKANAHLIAAAPDMYKMLKECIQVFGEDNDYMVEEIEGLLAKARGDHNVK